MADFNTKIALMLFEAGGLCADLPAHESGAALAAEISKAAQAAMDEQQAHFTLELGPVEVGMALSAASGSPSPLSQTVADKLRKALAAKLQELGITYPEQDEPEVVESTPAPEAPTDSSEPADAPAGDQETDLSQDTESEDSTGGIL